MIIYIGMVLISIVFIILGNKAPKKWQKIICYILAALPFFAVSAFRYNVGTDYYRTYGYTFELVRDGKPVPRMEKGYVLIIKFALLITNQKYIIYIITSAIIIGFIMFTIFAKSKNPILSILIFFLAGFFFDSLNITRQYIAISLVIFGHMFLLGKKRFWPIYILFALLAMSIHLSAAIMLILLIFPKKMWASYIWVLPVSVIILLLREKIFDILGLVIQHTKFAVYLTGKFAQGEISVLFIAENLCMYLLMYYFYRKNKKLNNLQTEDILYLNIQACALLTMIIGTCHMQFIRVALYFSVFQIISVPYFISKMPTADIVKDINKISKEKIKLDKFEKHLPKVLTVCIVLCFTFAIVRTNVLENTNEVRPYRTIFSSELEFK